MVRILSRTFGLFRFFASLRFISLSPLRPFSRRLLVLCCICLFVVLVLLSASRMSAVPASGASLLGMRVSDEPITPPPSDDIFRSFLIFLRRSYLHNLFLFVLFSFLLSSRVISLIVVLIFAFSLHAFRFRRADPFLVDAILLRGAFAKPNEIPVVFGHRGAGVEMPENTLAAFRTCAENGGDGVELDVELTADGVAVVLHDDTVDRTTDGVGAINSLTFAETRALNAAAKHPKGAVSGVQEIPTLEAVLTLCLEKKLNVFIEIKSATFSGVTNAARAVDAIAGLYSRYPDLYRTAMVCSFDPRAIYLMRRRNPSVVVALIWRPWVNSFKIDGTRQSNGTLSTGFLAVYDIFHRFLLEGFLWHYLGVDIISLNKNALSANDVAWWRDREVSPVTWTVNTFAEKEFFARLDVPVMTDAMLEDVVEQT